MLDWSLELCNYCHKMSEYDGESDNEASTNILQVIHVFFIFFVANSAKLTCTKMYN
jgi:hypothetical protein